MTDPHTPHPDRVRDAETLAGLLRLTGGVQITPDEADQWLQGDPDTDKEVET